MVPSSIRRTHRFGTALVGLTTGAALLLSACSSEAAPSKDQLVSKLSDAPDFASIKSAVPADQYNSFVGCIADFLEQKGQASDLNEYISGKRSLNDVRGSGSESDAQAAGKQCATQAGIGQSSASSESPSAATS